MMYTNAQVAVMAMQGRQLDEYQMVQYANALLEWLNENTNEEEA